VVDTAPQDVVRPEERPVVTPHASYVVAPYSVLVLISEG
jgi:hypothetical protein